MANEDLSKLKIDKSQITVSKQKRKRSTYLAGAFLLIILIVVLYFAGFFTSTHTVQVTSVSLIYPSQTFTSLNASGYVVAQRKSAVASKVSGRLVSLAVEEGSKVKKGQVIARLENEDAIAARDQAEANLKVAGFNLDQAHAELKDATLSFNRNKELIAQGLISQRDYDSSEARYRKSVAAVEASEASVRAQTAALRGAQVSLEYTLIRAPFDAVVLTKNADLGDIVTPLGAAADAKAAVVTIADMESLQVEVDVSESNLKNVSVGQPCEIQLDALPESRFRGKVHMIVPTADRTKATVLVKVQFIDRDNRILPEMSAKVAFLFRPVKSEEKTPLRVVHSDAVINRNGEKAVFLVNDDNLVETFITVGKNLGKSVEVVNGLSVGDRVVINPSRKLKNKDRIKIAQQ
jgi:RND family efflux transporter MFP subunit